MLVTFAFSAPQTRPNFMLKGGGVGLYPRQYGIIIIFNIIIISPLTSQSHDTIFHCVSLWTRLQQKSEAQNLSSFVFCFIQRYNKVLIYIYTIETG